MANLGQMWVNGVERGSLSVDDTVDHNILLTKLQFYGIRGFCHKWFALQLRNRTQTCLMNSFMSTPKLVKYGVPREQFQDLYFFYYILMTYQIVCIFHNLECMQMTPASLFASVDLKNIDDCLNYDLNKVYEWLSANELTLNLTKLSLCQSRRNRRYQHFLKFLLSV